MLTTIIERGDSGTRAMSHTLSASGVWMGEALSGSGDLLSPQAGHCAPWSRPCQLSRNSAKR